MLRLFQPTEPVCIILHAVCVHCQYSGANSKEMIHRRWNSYIFAKWGNGLAIVLHLPQYSGQLSLLQRKANSLPDQMNLKGNMTNSAHSFHSHISFHWLQYVHHYFIYILQSKGKSGASLHHCSGQLLPTHRIEQTTKTKPPFYKNSIKICSCLVWTDHPVSC